jgi:toxin ParE1/3/4
VPDLEWKASAVADLMAIVDYISDDNPDAAIALMDEIQGKVEQLSAHPKRCRPGRVNGTRELVVRPNYVVVYAGNPGGGDGPAGASRRAGVALIGHRLVIQEGAAPLAHGN